MKASTAQPKRDNVLTEEQVINLIRTRQGCSTLRDFAAELGVSPSYLSYIYSGARSPGAKILKLFGLRKRRNDVVEYQRRRTKLTLSDVVDMIRDGQDQKTQRQFAQEIGIGESYLSDIYGGLRRPGGTVLNFFGISQKRKSFAAYEVRDN